MAEPNTMDTAQITARLKTLIAERHDYPHGQEWAVLFELRSNTGLAQEPRYVDVFALNLWPSKKHWRVAYEVKATRADFLRELAKPQKRAWAMDIAHEFWFVCAPGVARKEEIPTGCGLLVADEALTQLKRVVVARQGKPRAFSDTEISALVRTARGHGQADSLLFRYNGQTLDEAALNALLDSRIEARMYDRVQAEAERKAQQRLSEAASLLAGYAAELEAAGLPAPKWMKEFGNGRTPAYDWDARGWVRQCVHPGPQARDVEAALRQMRGLQQHMRNSLEYAEATARSLQALLAAKAPCDGA